jgi:outer membrane protein TolC
MNFKKVSIIILIIFIFALPLQAAEALTLAEAIDIAKNENFNLKLAEINYQKAKINQQALELQNKYNYTETQKLEINKNYLSSEKNYQDSEANVIKSIISQYTGLWLKQKEIEAQRLTTKAEERLYNEMQARFELAQISQLDLLDQSNNYKQANNSLENLQDNYQLSLVEFKTDLNLGDEKIKINELAEPKLWTISEEEAIEKALKNSYSIKIAEIDYQLAKEQYNKNKIDSAQAQQRTAAMDLKAAEITLAKTKKELINSVIKAYLTLTQAEKNINLMKDNLKKSQTQYNQIKRQFELGSVTQTTVLQYESTLLDSQYQLKNAYLNYYLAKENLADLLNMQPGVTINVQE